MSLLIVTQKVDAADPLLGFFHRWIVEFAKSAESVTVICLEKGSCQLPANVRVFSLGKEKHQSRAGYITNFFAYVWRERKTYDSVFVHMNQEYVLLAGPLWKMLGKKVMLWRNHPNGTMLTRLAVMWADSVFCTSSRSFTAQFKKTKIMPAGSDVDHFAPQFAHQPKPRSVLYLGRISSIKKVDVLVEALKLLSERRVQFDASLYGGMVDLPYERAYFERIKSDAQPLVTAGRLIFHEAVSNDEALQLYAQHEILVNMTPTGSFDKVILEMMACGRIALVSNVSFENIMPPAWKDRLIFKEGDPADCAAKLEYLLALSSEEKIRIGEACREIVVRDHSLHLLVSKILHEISS